MKVQVCDPPGGWKYGFPKPIPSDVDVIPWLIEQGYPKEEIDKYGEHFYCRYWVTEVDEDTMSTGMIEDCFLSWYEETYPDLDITLDDVAWEIRRAYYAGWKCCITTGRTLDEQDVLDQEHIHDHV